MTVSEQTPLKDLLLTIFLFQQRRSPEPLKNIGENKTASVSEISLKATDSVPVSQVFAEIVPLIVVLPISAVPPIASASRIKGVVLCA